MIAFGATLDNAKTKFFQADMLIRKISKMDEMALKFVGAHVRQRAMTQIRPGGVKGAISKPGESPRTHGRRLLRTFMEFDLEQGGQSVVVGPAKLNFINYDAITEQPVKGTIPKLLEEGGDYKQKQVQDSNGLWRRFDHRTANGIGSLPVTLSGGLVVPANDPRAILHQAKRGIAPASTGTRPTRFVVKHMEARPNQVPALNKEIAAGLIHKAWDQALHRVAKSVT